MIHKPDDRTWTYFQNWTLSHFEQDGYYIQTLGDENGEEIYGEIPLYPGKYRIITTNRLPNGNIFAKKLVFELTDGQKKEIRLMQTEARSEDLLEDNDITDFILRREDGTACRISELVKDQTGLFIWLEESKEPTEHILNEIYQRRDSFASMTANLYFVIKDAKAKEDPTITRTRLSVPKAEFLLDDFDSNMSILAR